MPGYQLVNFPIILEALIEDFQCDHGRTEKTPDSHNGIRSGQKSFPLQCHTRKDRLENLRSRSLHHPLNDKVLYGLRNRNNDDQERNPPGEPKDGRGTRTRPGKKDHPPPDTILRTKTSNYKGKRRTSRTKQ
ncbi:hypothetical protein Tco_0258354 [Tanacetum coccineum]